jgi:hypothetical protein
MMLACFIISDVKLVTWLQWSLPYLSIGKVSILTLWCSNCSKFCQWETPQASSFDFLVCPHRFLSTCLLFWHTLIF